MQHLTLLLLGQPCFLVSHDTSTCCVPGKVSCDPGCVLRAESTFLAQAMKEMLDQQVGSAQPLGAQDGLPALLLRLALYAACTR